MIVCFDVVPCAECAAFTRKTIDDTAMPVCDLGLMSVAMTNHTLTTLTFRRNPGYLKANVKKQKQTNYYYGFCVAYFGKIEFTRVFSDFPAFPATNQLCQVPPPGPRPGATVPFKFHSTGYLNCGIC